jgi:RNA polymerase sigma factor (sigma-70 family)
MGIRRRDRREFWVEFYEANFADVHRFIVRNLWSSGLDTDAMTQDVFLRMLQRIDEYPMDAIELRKIAFKIALNICRDGTRRLGKQREVLTDEQIETFQYLGDLDPTGSSVVEAMRVRDVLAEMSELEHRVIDLRGQGFTFGDIAEQLALKDASAADYKFDVAKKKFQRLYKDE